MAKFGVGVGEEFPVDEPASPPPAGAERACGRHGHGRRFGWLHLTLHVLFRVAVIALVIAAAVSLLRPHDGGISPNGFYPYHHHGFFPFFPVLLIVLLVFALARGGRYRRWRHWHDSPRRDGGEEV